MLESTLPLLKMPATAGAKDNAECTPEIRQKLSAGSIRNNLGNLLGVSVEQARERKGYSCRQAPDEHGLEGTANDGRA